MRTDVRRALVETDGRDEAVQVRPEARPQFDGVRVGVGANARVLVGDHSEHGQFDAPAWTTTEMPSEEASAMPLSSTARERMFTVRGLPVCQL